LKLGFMKMNGSGNDFVIIDNTRREVVLDAAQIARLCDRRLGIGADGFIMIEPEDGFDFFMRFHNSDGSPAEMCGNGACCAAHFAAAIGRGEAGADGTMVRFLTGSGAAHARVKENRVTIELMDAEGMRQSVPVQVAPPECDVHFMTVGTRHALVPVPDAGAMSSADVVRWGRALRNDPAFAPQGANVNFMSVGRDGRIVLRTYEKGVEDETLACGTGSIAAAVWYGHLGLMRSPVRILQRSGDELRASFELTRHGACNVILDAPVAVNFVGIADV
jgi:diaminopimelate epimerase